MARLSDEEYSFWALVQHNQRLRRDNEVLCKENRALVAVLAIVIDRNPGEPLLISAGELMTTDGVIRTMRQSDGGLILWRDSEPAEPGSPGQ